MSVDEWVGSKESSGERGSSVEVVGGTGSSSLDPRTGRFDQQTCVKGNLRTGTSHQVPMGNPHVKLM